MWASLALGGRGGGRCPWFVEVGLSEVESGLPSSGGKGGTGGGIEALCGGIGCARSSWSCLEMTGGSREKTSCSTESKAVILERYSMPKLAAL